METRLENEEICIIDAVALLPIRTELTHHDNLHTFCAQE